ncbi:MAG: hypothetical protein R3D69_04790 [Xanthobacteraceae bacterium]
MAAPFRLDFPSLAMTKLMKSKRCASERQQFIGGGGEADQPAARMRRARMIHQFLVDRQVVDFETDALGQLALEHRPALDQPPEQQHDSKRIGLHISDGRFVQQIRA